MSKSGRRPDEYASKSSHSNIINDSDVLDYLNNCIMPKTSQQINIPKSISTILKIPTQTVIKHIIAFDGGYTEVIVKNNFPSATIAFFQFGALFFDTCDLEELGKKPFIDPKDMEKLKNIQRLKLVLPTKNITVKNQLNLTNSIRKTLYDFFCKQSAETNFNTTLKWFIFSEYLNVPSPDWILSTCPNCGKNNIPISSSSLSDYKTKCPYCNDTIYLIDVFRLHEAIDNEIGAGGILGYVTTLLEQIILIHTIKLILLIRPSLLSETLFIKDGPLAFFGQTANMYKPMRKLIQYLLDKHNLFLAGLEKSGSFVEHADEIKYKLSPGQVILLDNDYIYNYIIPGTSDPNNSYGRTTYYSNKIIFKAYDERIYVITIPTKKILLNPQKKDLKNLDEILYNLQKLKCDMYDNALIPVALANRLVSLSNHPSSVILEKFAINNLC